MHGARGIELLESWALTRVAGRATEKDLLNIALHGTAYHVERTVRLFRRGDAGQELLREDSQHEIEASRITGKRMEVWC